MYVTDHIGENAELYALGALDENELRQTEDHARDCTPCRKLLGNAERIVSDLEFEMPPLVPPRRLQERLLRSARVLEDLPQNRRVWRWYALAALLILGLVSTTMAIQIGRSNNQLRANDAIVAVLASSDFGHVSLRARTTTAPIAKAICEKSGKWIYLVVARANPDLTLYGERNNGRVRLGRPVSQGTSATLFVERPGKFSALELMANGRVVASATTHYPR